MRVDDQRVADAAGHQVPALALVGAHVDALARAIAGVDDLVVALVGGAARVAAVPGCAGVRVQGRPLFWSRTTEVALPASTCVQVWPVFSLRQMPPLVPAQGGVDDHLAGGGELGIDGDLVGRGADELAIAGGGVDRQDVAGAVEVVGGV